MLEETGRREKRLRLPPSRVVVYFVLALALFEHRSYRTAWSKLTTALAPLALPRPAPSSQVRARRRVGSAPPRRLFETLAPAMVLPRPHRPDHPPTTPTKLTKRSVGPVPRIMPGMRHARVGGRPSPELCRGGLATSGMNLRISWLSIKPG
ncbi:transposase domain-containing protein [Streptomyces noursei]|uniref:transposase domain-containing protein n=1 Tax=Streptomyces noursei TaxID=1971 RepID=UPI001E4C02C0